MVQPTTRPRKTIQDYLALPHDARAELISGELYVTPAPSFEHQRVVTRLLRRLADECERLTLGEVVVSPLDVHLPTGDVVQPDLVVVAPSQAALCRPSGFHGSPRLLIEILSPGNAERDRIVKRDLYASSGVAEYWIVDPGARSVEVFVLRGRVYAAAGWFTGDGPIVSPTLPGLRIGVGELF